MTDWFLGHLVGSWTLEGTMGSAPLRQKVVAEWAVQGRFLRVHFWEDGPSPSDRPRYEAVYMIGRDTETGEYVLHLFDTFGASYARTVGVGTRRGDSVEFIFHYPKGDFSNTFTWHEQNGEWEMLLRQREGGGDWKTFAIKRLVRGG